MFKYLSADPKPFKSSIKYLPKSCVVFAPYLSPSSIPLKRRLASVSAYCKAVNTGESFGEKSEELYDKYIKTLCETMATSYDREIVIYMLKKGFITNQYIDAIIDLSVKENDTKLSAELTDYKTAGLG